MNFKHGDRVFIHKRALSSYPQLKFGAVGKVVNKPFDRYDIIEVYNPSWTFIRDGILVFNDFELYK